MKFLHNTFTILTLLAIGSAGAKGLKTTSSATTPTRITPTTTTTTTTNRAPQQQSQQQRHPQKETYRQLLAELKNIKEHDVLTKDKLKYTDKIVNFWYRVDTSNLEEIEKEALAEALAFYHIIGFIVPFNEIDNPSPKTKQRAEDLRGDLNKRVEKLKEQALPKQDRSQQNQPYKEQALSLEDQPKPIDTKRANVKEFISTEVKNKKMVFYGINAQAEKIFMELNDIFDRAQLKYGVSEQTYQLIKEEIYHVISDLRPNIKKQLIPLLKDSISPVFNDMGAKLEKQEQFL